jgi:hypothetical protein
MEPDRFLIDLFNSAGLHWQHAQEHAEKTGAAEELLGSTSEEKGKT